MAITITKLKMWKNPGYTRQCQEIPLKGSKKLPLPDYTNTTNLRPRKSNILSSIELPLSYLEVYEMSYLYMEANDGATPTPHTMSMFGWILSVEEIATSNDAVRITWTPDYWRTYSDQVTFGSALVTRTASATYKRPYRKHPRKWLISRIMPFATHNPWCCVVYNKTVGSATEIEHICWEMGGTMESGGVTYTGLTIEEVMKGLIDETFGISPNAITGVFITPYQPHAGQLNFGAPGNSNVWYWQGFGSSTTIYNMTSGQEMITDDTHEAVIVDPYGAIVGRVPYGCKVSQCKIYSDIGTTDLRTMVCMNDVNDISGMTPEQSGAVGRIVSLSPLTAPVNSNAFKEYIYSGQRDYDKRNAELQRNEARLKGYTSAGESLVGGAVAGGVSAGPLGAVGGLVAGGFLNIASNELNYDIQGKLNDKYQRLTDDLYANQTSNLLLNGGGMGFTKLLNQWNWVQLVADTPSINEYNNEITYMGYETEYMASGGSVNLLINTGGAIQLQNLVLTGAVPPEAKTYIKNILSNGVRIVENNPTGVVP